MKRYVDNQYSTWKVFLDSYLAEFGGAFLTKCNYDVRFLPGNSTRNTELAQDVIRYHLTGWLNEIIWNNKFLRINENRCSGASFLLGKVSPL